MQYASWMRDAAPSIESRRLWELTLPGSHNAGAVDLRSVTLLDFGSAWANTQGCPIREQLKAGIRYLDLHVQYLHLDAAAEAYLVHTPAGGITTFFGQSVEVMLQEVAAYLRAHPQEVVVLHFSRFYAMTPDRHRRLAARIQELLGQWLIPPRSADACLGTVWQQQKQAVVLYGPDQPGSTGREQAATAAPAFRQLEGKAGICQAPVPAFQALPLLHAHFERALQARRLTRLSVLHGTCTVSALAMLRGYLNLKNAFTDRAELAAYLNPVLLSWLRLLWFDQQVNILALDFAAESELVPLAVALNQRI